MAETIGPYRFIQDRRLSSQRITGDTLLLSEFVLPILDKDASVIELGTGAGAVVLSLCAESEVKKFTGVELPQVPHTFAHHHGMFGYMIEYQLAMGEATVGCRAKMRNPNGVMNITELTLLAMERCKTAREAIKLMGSLAEKYSYGLDPGEMLAVADPKEVWVFEIMPVGPLWTPRSGRNRPYGLVKY